MTFHLTAWKGKKKRTSRDNALQTPPPLYRSLSEVFGPFDLDVCASEQNHLAPAWFDKNMDCCLRPWGPMVLVGKQETRPTRAFCNPPFDEDLGCGEIVRQALQEAIAGRCSTLVMIPGYKREFDWWHECVTGAQGDGATGLLDSGGPLGNRRIDFWRNDAPLGDPNQQTMALIWFQEGLVSRAARWHYRLPWVGTLWVPGFDVRVPSIVESGVLSPRRGASGEARPGFDVRIVK